MIKKSIKQVSFLWVGSVLGAIFAFLTQVLLARMLGVEEYGLFSSSLTLALLLVPLIGLGVSQFWLKVFGEEGKIAIRWLPASFVLILINLFIVLFVVFFIALNQYTDSSRTVFLLLSVFMVGQVFIEFVSIRFQLEEEFVKLTIWQLLPHFLRLALIIIFIFLADYQLSIIEGALSYSLVSLGFIVIGFVLLKPMWDGKAKLIEHEKIKEKDDLLIPTVSNLFTKAMPFGLAALFHMIYYQSNIVFLKYMVDDTSAGYYAVAFSVMAAIYLFPSTIYQKYLLPKMHRWAYYDSKKFYEVYLLGNKMMLISGVVSMLVIWLTVFWVVPLVFGEEYRRSVIIINILALSAPFLFLAFNSGSTMSTKNFLVVKIKYMAIVCLFNIMMNYILISLYQEIGAAISTVITNIILFMLYMRGVKKYVF